MYERRAAVATNKYTIVKERHEKLCVNLHGEFSRKWMEFLSKRLKTDEKFIK